MLNPLRTLINWSGFDVVRFSRRNLSLRDLWDLRRLKSEEGSGITSSELLGYPVCMASRKAFAYLFEEIFVREIYKFESNNPAPRILDCGANIGLATLYFKQMYPKARITCFEPDNNLFDILRQNLESAKITDVEAINAGVGAREGTFAFYKDKLSTSGSFIDQPDSVDSAESFQMVRIRKHLDSEIDLLKVDIEGASRSCSMILVTCCIT